LKKIGKVKDFLIIPEVKDEYGSVQTYTEFVVCVDQNIKIYEMYDNYDANNGYKLFSSISAIALSSDGNLLAIGDYSGNLNIVNR
jgi:hypothetical protein